MNAQDEIEVEIGRKEEIEPLPASRVYKRPESVLVVIHTLAGEVLLLRRTHPRYFWQSVTGSLEWGETPQQAALRELKEETGLESAGKLVDCRYSLSFPILPAWRPRYAPQVRINREHWFSLALGGRRLVRLQREEHSEHRWLPWPAAMRLASSWTNQRAIGEILTPEVLRPFC